MNYLYIALIWSAYCTLHSYLISVRFTRLLMLILKKYFAFYRLSYVVISILLIIPVLHYTSMWSGERIIDYKPPFSIIRYGLIIFSLLLFLKAFFFDYDVLSFFGVRQIMNIKKENKGDAGTIKKKGLLGIVRHPMYFALIIFLWCNTFRVSDIVVNTVLTVYVVIGTILEERKLILEFGDQYVEYKKEVPMIIPFSKLNRTKN